MKKLLKACTFSLLYVVLHYVIQIVISTFFGIFGFISEGGGIPDEDVFTNIVFDYMGQILIISSIISILVIILIYAIRRKNIFKKCKFTGGASVKNLVFGAMFGLSANFIVSIIMGLLMEAGLFKDAFGQYQTHISSIMNHDKFIFTLIGVGILTPIIEELIFRGAIVDELGAVFSPTVIIVIQGLLFGVFHLNVIQGVYTALIGMFFGYIVYKTNSIWPAIAAHIAMNTLGVSFSTPDVADFIENYAVIVMAAMLILIVTSIVCFIRLPVKTAPAMVTGTAADASTAARASTEAESDTVKGAEAKSWADAEAGAEAKSWVDAEAGAEAEVWADAEAGSEAKPWTDTEAGVKAKSWADAEADNTFSADKPSNTPL